MAVAVILLGCGVVQFVTIAVIVGGARGAGQQEQEDREQMEYLRQYAEKKRQKQEMRRAKREQTVAKWHGIWR